MTLRRQQLQGGSEQIEITESMIRAGLRELDACLGSYGERDLVMAVYSAMARLSPSADHPACPVERDAG